MRKARQIESGQWKALTTVFGTGDRVNSWELEEQILLHLCFKNSFLCCKKERSGAGRSKGRLLRWKGEEKVYNDITLYLSLNNNNEYLHMFYFYPVKRTVHELFTLFNRYNTRSSRIWGPSLDPVMGMEERPYPLPRGHLLGPLSSMWDVAARASWLCFPEPTLWPIFSLPW